MRKLVNVLLYSLLLAVVMAGMMGIRYFIVQEEQRVELEAEKRLAAQQQAAENEPENSSSQPEDIRMVLVKKLPVYKNENIVKIRTDHDTEILSYGDEITVISESGLYAKVQTASGTVGYLWSDCIGVPSDQDKQADEPARVIVIDAEGPKPGQEIQEEGSAQDDAWTWSLKTAEKLEKKLEARGCIAVMTKRDSKNAVSTAKSAELANQIEADAVIHIYIGSSDDPADSGAAAYCCTGDSPDADSRKLGKYVLKYYTKATGFDSAGILEGDEYLGIQRSKRPAILFRMGDLSGEQEGAKMRRQSFRTKMAKGIADGIDAYFKNQS